MTRDCWVGIGVGKTQVDAMFEEVSVGTLGIKAFRRIKSDVVETFKA